MSSEPDEAVRRLRKFLPSVIAEGVLQNHGRLRGERREVTVLFADAEGFTSLSESLDAESVFELINDLLGRLIECVSRYGGMVDKFTGDGLMAVFGAPIAHESDSERAVRAALDMQKAATEFEPIALAQLGAPVQIRIGIHSGPAVAGVIGTREQVAYTVIGETVNLASRVESLAQPGHIVVSSQVYHQTSALFDFRAMGSVQVKGISEPVAIYEAVQDRAEPLPTRGVAGVGTVYLGRDAELGRLRAMLGAFLNDRRGRLVMIRGEAGMGKSRLVSEALSIIPSARVSVWQGRALPYAQGMAYGVFRSLLQDAMRGLRPEEAWDAEVTPALRPFLRQMSGLALAPEEETSIGRLEPERVKHLTVLAAREWILGQARRRPTVLILEDFHWADDLSRDALQSMVDLVWEAPVFLFVIERPRPGTVLEIEPPASEGSRSTPLRDTVELQPLPPEHSRALLTHMVDLSGLPDPLVDTILTRAEGNPFYIEEFVRMLIEKELLALADGRWRVASAIGLEGLEIPTTLRGLLMARVDRLPEDLQDVLRSAAVVGLQFSARLLGAVEHRLHGTANVLPPLDRLEDLGLLEKRPQVGEEVFAFRHILTQETVYRSLLRSQRPGLHRAVAECIESLHAADLTLQADTLALHYDRARVRDKAMHYGLLAGDRARARYANREAIEHYSRALQLSQHLGSRHAERWQAAFGLGQVEQHIGEYEEAIACYEAALEEWKDASPDVVAQVMLRLGRVWDKKGEVQEAERWLRQGLSQLDGVGDSFPELRAQLYSALGSICRRQGDLVAAQTWFERSLSLVDNTEHLDVLSTTLNRLGGVHYQRGEWHEAAECVERAIRLRHRLGDVVGYARSLNNLAILKFAGDDWDGALADFESAAESNERIGDNEALALACTNLGILYTERGEWARAEENLLRSFSIAQSIGHPYELALAHNNLGRLYLYQERWRDCNQHLGSAIRLYGEAGGEGSLNLFDSLWLRSTLDLAMGMVDAAEQGAERSLKLLRDASSTTETELVERGRYERLKGRIARARGDLTSSCHHLERSAAILEVTGPQIEVGRTLRERGLLLLDLGQADRARKSLEAARQAFENLGASPDLQRVDEVLGAIAGLSA